MIHVGGYDEYCGGVQYRGVLKLLQILPTVLNTLHGTHNIPHMHHDIPHGTEHTPRYSRYPHIYHDIPHGTEHTPRYSRYPHGTHDIPHGTAHTLYRVITWKYFQWSYNQQIACRKYMSCIIAVKESFKQTIFFIFDHVKV